MGSTAGQLLLNSTKPETFMLTAEQQDALPAESKMALEQVDDLKYFLATAPANWQVDQIIRRYLLPTGEYVSCVLWRNLFHITGTDIVRALTYRFQAFGRPVRNIKKFEEGVFSDLRNLKNGTDASLEEPKSGFLDLLYKNNCIRTQKKQKVFYWFSVPHDRLFLDALERDLKRERMGTESTTAAVAEPALSFVFDATQSLFEQLTKSLQHNAASEVGASLAAQQAQNNIMAAQYGSMSGNSLGLPFALAHRGSGSGPPVQMPSAHYYARAQSVQSAVPLDYRVPQTSWTSLAGEPPQPSQPMAGRPFQPGHTHSHSTPALFHDPFAAEVRTAEESEDAEAAAFRREYSYDETIGFAMPRVSSDLAPDLTDTESTQQPPAAFADEVPLSPGQVPPLPGSYDAGAFEGDAELSALPLVPQPGMRPSLGLQFNMFEGSPTYKQRRRRQSIPSSVLMQEQLQQPRRAPGSTAMSTSTSQQDFTDATENELLSSVDQYSEAGGDFAYMQSLEQGAMDGMAFGLHRLQEHRQPCALQPIPGPPPATGSSGSSGSRPVSRDGSDLDGMFAFGRAGSPASTNGGAGQPYPHARQYACPRPGCGRGFRRLEHLKRHVRTHTHERPFVCALCGKRFSRSDNLAQHRRTHERGYASGASSPAASVLDLMEPPGQGLTTLQAMPMQRAATTGSMMTGSYGPRFYGGQGMAPTSHGPLGPLGVQPAPGLPFFQRDGMPDFTMGGDTALLMQAYPPDLATTEMIKTLSMPGATLDETGYLSGGYYGAMPLPGALHDTEATGSSVDAHGYLPLTPRASQFQATSQMLRAQEEDAVEEQETPRVQGGFAQLEVESGC